MEQISALSADGFASPLETQGWSGKVLSNASFAASPNTPCILNDHLGRSVENHPGLSGLKLITSGEESLKSRLSLIRSAQVSVDLQYYAINNDITSNLLVEAIIQAAERGVRIRFLIDDISVGKVRKSLTALDTIPNIEVRIFNPITTQSQSVPARVVALFAQLPRATKRMHNKALIADNQAAITGGRNLGDEYFNAHAEKTFKDLDILTAGPVTADISDSFDKFWNDENAYPIADLYKIDTTARYVAKLKRKLRENREKELKDDPDRNSFTLTFPQYIPDPDKDLVWAKAEFVADDPDKIRRHDVPLNSKPIRKILSLVDSAKESFMIVSPYFVPLHDGADWIESLRKRGLKVRIITNSLTSTDVVAVHTGYCKYRARLLESGIELYELKAVDGKRTKQRLFGRSAPSYASLHAKVYTVDRDISVVGSLNFDPRSAQLNTEVALVIESVEINATINTLYKDVIAPETSYSVSLEDGAVVWRDVKKGRAEIHRHEPDVSLWRRLQNFLIGFLPVEDQL